MCVYVCVWLGMPQCMWRAEDAFVESVSFLSPHMGSEDDSEVSSLTVQAPSPVEPPQRPRDLLTISSPPFSPLPLSSSCSHILIKVFVL